MEIWKDIKGWEGKYKISNKGSVYSYFLKRNIKPVFSRDGYHRFVLQNKGYKEPWFIHRLVACAFIDNPENKETVNHINGVKTDNRVENLEWATRSENELHSFRVLGKVAYQPMKGRFGKEHNKSRAVLQLSLDGFLLNEFGSILEAHRVTGVHAGNIGLCIKGERPKAGGYIWK